MHQQQKIMNNKFNACHHKHSNEALIIKKYKINPTTLPKWSTNVKFNYSSNILKPYSIKTTQKIILGLPLSDK